MSLWQELRDKYMEQIPAILLGVIFFLCVIFLAIALSNIPVYGAEIDIVAETIALESSSESFEAQVMVAQVILTRAQERGLTLEEVCLQPYQFSCHNKGIRGKMRKRTRWELLEAHKALKHAQGATNLPKANLYHDTSIKPPYWAKSAKVQFVKKIGNLLFYYEKREVLL